jgi:hypothetical protein
LAFVSLLALFKESKGFDVNVLLLLLSIDRATSMLEDCLVLLMQTVE